MSTYLITGAASGIGAKCAEYFAERGHSVIGLDVKPIGNSAIRSFVADITAAESLEEIKSALLEEGVKLDGIISVAGVHAMASFVETEFSSIERLMNINLLGTMRVNSTFHSLLAERGRIIIITSEVATYDPMPFNGLYNVSKTALECYAQALRQELNLIGQRVITVRPGSTETELARGSATATAALAESTVLYRTQAKHFSEIVRKFTGTPISPEALARLVYKAATVKHPRLAYAKHRNAGLVLLNLLPKRLQCAIIKSILK